MCGITAIYNIGGNEPVDPLILGKMTEIIAHRGPDDFGYWFCNTQNNTEIATKDVIEACNGNYNLGLGHRRLSILDLSPLGHQPMKSADGSVWIVFNGEVYNYIEIREDLKAKGYTFLTGTDTEVIIYAYKEWGEECVKRFNGMFSFILWDKNTNKLFMARDRFGIKPFNYYFDGKSFVVSSEIKSILEFPGIKTGFNRAAVYNYITMYPDPIGFDTYFNNIKELPSAHYAVIKDGRLDIKRYWSIDPENKVSFSTDEEYREAFYNLFEDAIKLRLRSDVPVGNCLSGGLDSSSIVCLSSRFIPQIHTFSACFDEPEIDERPYMTSVIESTNSRENRIFPSVDKLMADVDRLIWHQDEPFSSSSIFAQWCVMEMVSKTEVKVLLDGQGSDEILLGYTMHFPSLAYDYLKQLRIADSISEYNAIKANHRLTDAKMLWYMALNLPDNLKRMHNPKVNWVNPAYLKEVSGLSSVNPHGLKFKNSTDNLLYKSLTGSLKELLRYEDRNSMAFSIESRIPFLDYRLVEFCYGLPLNQKMRNGTSKYLLRSAMNGILPDKIRLRQDKIGFLTPEFRWFQSQVMRKMVLDLINSHDLRSKEIYDFAKLKVLLDNLDKYPLTEAIRIGKLFWRVVNLEMWLKKFNLS